MKQSNFKRGSRETKFLTRAAMIATLYVVLSYLSTIFGLASGVIQFRLSEVLCILPVLMPEAIPGLFIGCLLANIVGGCIVWDVIFGSIATLIGAVGCYCLRRLPQKLRWVCTLPNLISNCVIVPLVLIYAYGVSEGFFFLMLTVGLGEAVCGVIGGSIFYEYAKKIKF